MLLLAVVGEVYLCVEGLGGVGAGGGAQVGRVVVVDFEVGRDQHPDPDIELPAVVEERLLDCLLRDPAFYRAYHPLLTGFDTRNASISLKLLERMMPLPWLSDSGFTNHTFF